MCLHFQRLEFREECYILQGPCIHEGQDNMYFINIENHLPSDVGSHPERPESLIVVLRTPEN